LKPLPPPMLAALINIAGGLATGLATGSGGGTETMAEIMERLAPLVLRDALIAVGAVKVPMKGADGSGGNGGGGGSGSGGSSSSGGSGSDVSNGNDSDELFPADHLEVAATRLLILAVSSGGDGGGAAVTVRAWKDAIGGLPDNDGTGSTGSTGSGPGPDQTPKSMTPCWLMNAAKELAHRALETETAPRLATLACLGACVGALRGKEAPELDRILMKLVKPITTALDRHSLGRNGGGGFGLDGGGADVPYLHVLRLGVRVLKVSSDAARHGKAAESTVRRVLLLAMSLLDVAVQTYKSYSEPASVGVTTDPWVKSSGNILTNSSGGAATAAALATLIVCVRTVASDVLNSDLLRYDKADSPVVQNALIKGLNKATTTICGGCAALLSVPLSGKPANTSESAGDMVGTAAPATILTSAAGDLQLAVATLRAAEEALPIFGMKPQPQVLLRAGAAVSDSPRAKAVPVPANIAFPPPSRPPSGGMIFGGRNHGGSHAALGSNAPTSGNKRRRQS
ncbi:hypothetical protein Vafri_22037, partial [Volvox africanus]